MQEEQLIKYIKALTKELRNLQDMVTRLDNNVRNLRVGGNTVVKTVPLGVKDLTTAQLVAAFVKYHLNMEQLIALSDGRFSHDDIIKKLKRAGAIP